MNRDQNTSLSAHYAKSYSEVLANFNSTEEGLSREDVDVRLKEYGRNIFHPYKSDSIFKIAINQFASPLMYVLLIAGFVVLIFSGWTDSAIIFLVIILNALIGIFEETKSRNSMQALLNFSKSNAKVIREGVERSVSDEEVVPGDILVLRQGDKVVADARIISASGFRVVESSLTGESEPVEKNTDILVSDTELPDQLNMVFRGTLAVAGNATAVVVAIGSNTVFGKVAEKVSLIDAEMPLKQKIRKLSQYIGIAIFLCVTAFFYIGIFRGMPIFDIFMASVAMAVSLIPEGLPVVITLVLAKGVYRMAKRNALVKNMQAVEALGQASIIAVDKTGTITKNELTVLSVYINNKEYSVTGSGYDPKGDIIYKDEIIEVLNHPDLVFAGKIASLSADASISINEKGSAQVSGDPTEAAMLVFGEKIGFKQSEAMAEQPMVFEKPFSYESRFHFTLHKDGDRYLGIAVGEPESLITHISKVWTLDGETEISNKNYEDIEAKIELFGSKGLRVIMFASCYLEEPSIDFGFMPKLSFGGLFGMADVLREGVVEAIDKTREAGIRVVMITGDHLGTAKAIAAEAHIWKEGDIVISGKDLHTLRINDEGDLGNVSVFGRVLPEHKLEIVEAYKRKGEIVGMTGDGVNDAMSLRAAHLGMAMGEGGTDVAKEASDIILLDNNFNTIVEAISEGRAIYSTIKKVVLYLLSTGIGEFLSIAGAIILGFDVPLLPSQILWLNLVTNGVVVVALAFEPKPDIVKSRRSSGEIYGRDEFFRSMIMGAVMMIGTLYIFEKNIEFGFVAASTLALSLLAIFQWFNIWNCRSSIGSAFYKPFSNKYLILSVLASLALHLFAVYTPIMQSLLKTQSMYLSDWLLLFIIGSSIVWVEELRKLSVRMYANKY